MAVVTVIMAYVISMREWRAKSSSAESASEGGFPTRKVIPKHILALLLPLVAVANAISAMTKPTIGRKRPFGELKRYLAYYV